MQQFIYNTSILRGATFSRGLRLSTILFSGSSSTVTIALGPATFAVQSGMSVVVGQRVRAHLVGPPETDPFQFLEGPVTSYTGSLLTINADLIGGNSGTAYSSWQLTSPADLTGATFNATMQLLPDSCAGRVRSPVTINVLVTGDPTLGVFQLYLSPTETAALVLGEYAYDVTETPASSSDKFPILRGRITVRNF